MFDGWKIAAKTPIRTSLHNGKSDETIEILYHDDLESEYDIHSIMFSASSKEDVFYVLYTDGLFTIDYSSLKVSPPPSAQELRKFERPVTDENRRKGFFSKISEALWVLPKRSIVERVLEHSTKARYSPYASDLWPGVDFVDLGCGNGRRVLSEAARTPENLVGVDLRPPIYNDAVNVKFYRAGMREFLEIMRQRKTDVRRINADFVLGKMHQSEQTALLESACRILSDGGALTLCDDAATAKGLVQTLSMIPGIETKAIGFQSAKQWICATSHGRRTVEKFLEKHPEFNRDSEPGEERLVPASMPVMVKAAKNPIKDDGEPRNIEGATNIS